MSESLQNVVHDIRSEAHSRIEQCIIQRSIQCSWEGIANIARQYRSLIPTSFRSCLRLSGTLSCALVLLLLCLWQPRPYLPKLLEHFSWLWLIWELALHFLILRCDKLAVPVRGLLFALRLWGLFGCASVCYKFFCKLLLSILVPAGTANGWTEYSTTIRVQL